MNTAWLSLPLMLAAAGCQSVATGSERAPSTGLEPVRLTAAVGGVT